MGVFDEAGDLIAIAKTPDDPKPTAASGAAKDVVYRLFIILSNTDAIEIKIDPTVTVATKKEIQTALQQAKTYTDNALEQANAYTDEQLANASTQYGSFTEIDNTFTEATPLTTVLTAMPADSSLITPVAANDTDYPSDGLLEVVKYDGTHIACTLSALDGIYTLTITPENSEQIFGGGVKSLWNKTAQNAELKKQLHLLCQNGIEIAPPIDGLQVGDWVSLINGEIVKTEYYQSNILQGERNIDGLSTIIPLDGDYAALIYKDPADSKVLKGMIFYKSSNTAISTGSPKTLYTAPAEILYSIRGSAKLSTSNTGVICIGEKNTSDRGECVVIAFQRSGTSFTNITNKQIYTTNWTYTDNVLALTDSLFVICFQSIQNADMYLICQPMSGTALGTPGNLVDLYVTDQGGSQVHSVPICRISSTAFLAAYCYYSQSNKKTMYQIFPMAVSGTTITKGSPITIPDEIGYITKMFAMAEGKILVCGGASAQFAYCILTINGNDVSNVSPIKYLKEIKGSSYLACQTSATEIRIMSPYSSSTPVKNIYRLSFDGEILTIEDTAILDHGDEKYNMSQFYPTTEANIFYTPYCDYNQASQYKLALLDTAGSTKTSHNKYYGICVHDDKDSQIIATSGACVVNEEGRAGAKADNNVGIYLAKNVVELIDVLDR